MGEPMKRVVRLDLRMHPAFDERIAREAGIELIVAPRAGADAQTWAALAQAHVYHVSAAKDELPRGWFVTAQMLERCPQLLCVSSSGAGYDTIDVEACSKAGVLVVNQTGGNAVSVAEHALGMIIALAHRIVESDKRLRRETGFNRDDLMGAELAGKTVGIVGVGNIGTRVARLAEAFGMRVIACDPYLDEQEIGRRGARAVKFDDLLAESDYVSVHCPRNAETLKLFDARAFGRMKRGAKFVSTARGGIHDEKALHDALQSGQVGGAGLDVWDQEPPPLDHPLLKLDTVIATFHTAGVTAEARSNMAAIAADQIAAFLGGTKPPRIVNPPAWPAVEQRMQALLAASAK